uniref:Uncharacterized protein n=1 Tax=Plectus sambesii TaxID=2011161 RepID=A0A914UQ27_9BILA
MLVQLGLLFIVASVGQAHVRRLMYPSSDLPQHADSLTAWDSKPDVSLLQFSNPLWSLANIGDLFQRSARESYEDRKRASRGWKSWTGLNMGGLSYKNPRMNKWSK